MAKIKPQALLQQSKKKKGPSRISVINIVIYSLVLLLIGFFLFAAYRRWSQRSEIPAGHNARSVLEDTTFQEIKKGDFPRYVTLDTGKGSVTVELFKDNSPDVVDEFVKLCQDGYFKGIPFPRIIKNESSLEDEVFMLGTPKAKNEQGIFEISIITSSNSELKEKLIVFGRVTKGHHVIKEMDEEKNYEANRPIEIMDVTLHQKM